MSDRVILYQAIVNGDEKKISDVLRKGFDVKAIDINGDTLLHVVFKNVESSEAQLIDFLKIFLGRGSDINAKNKLEQTVVQLAVERRLRDVIYFCLRQDADTNASDCNGNTIAHFVIKEEFKKFDSLSEKDVEKINELEHESSSFVEWMAFKGIDFLYKRNKNNHSALYLANELNLQHIVLTLLNRVGDMHTVETDQSPLLCAYLENNREPYIYSNAIALTPIRSDFYESRHTYDIVNGILERTIYFDDSTLDVALRSAIAADLNIKVIKLILDRIFYLDSSSRTPMLRRLVDKFWDSEMKDSPLVLRAWILQGADVNGYYENGTLAHSLFRQHPNLETLQLLTEGDADFSATTSWGDSFLHLASEHCNAVEVVDFLVLNDFCDVNIANYFFEDKTPLQLAIIYRNGDVAKRLLELGAEVNGINELGQSPVSWVCRTGQIQVLEKMIECGIDLSHKNKDVQILLHLSLDHPEVVELLVKSGLDVNVKDKMGKTPLDRAMQRFEPYPVVRILVKAGARVDAKDEKNNSALYYALQTWSSCNDKTVTELLKYGADASDSKVLELVRKHSQERGIRKYEYVKRHFVKLNIAKLLDGIPVDVGEVNVEFHDRCLAEVEMLKTFPIDDRTSLYDLLHKNRSRRCAYLHNEKLKNLVDGVEIKKKFPEYSVLIMGCYNEAKMRKSLRQPTRDAWKKTTNFHLPDLCIDRILTHLSNGDLVGIIEASKVEGVDVL